jgi:hypothetical protein
VPKIEVLGMCPNKTFYTNQLKITYQIKQLSKYYSIMLEAYENIIKQIFQVEEKYSNFLIVLYHEWITFNYKGVPSLRF